MRFVIGLSTLLNFQSECTLAFVWFILEESRIFCCTVHRSATLVMGCVRVRESERAGEREREREGGRKKEMRENECVVS